MKNLMLAAIFLAFLTNLSGAGKDEWTKLGDRLKSRQDIPGVEAVLHGLTLYEQLF